MAPAAVVTGGSVVPASVWAYADARVATLRSRFQEFMMCPVASTNAPFKQAAVELWGYDDDAP